MDDGNKYGKYRLRGFIEGILIAVIAGLIVAYFTGQLKLETDTSKNAQPSSMVSITSTVENASGNDSSTSTPTEVSEPSPNSLVLSSLEPITSNAMSVAGAATDNVGNTYSDVIILESLSGGSAEYIINGNYTKVKGVFALPHGAKNHKTLGYFKIYGDGISLYTSSGMTAGVEPIIFEVDISGVKRLKIQLAFDLNGDLYDGWTTYLVSATLYQ